MHQVGLVKARPAVCGSPETETGSPRDAAGTASDPEIGLHAKSGAIPRGSVDTLRHRGLHFIADPAQLLQPNSELFAWLSRWLSAEREVPVSEPLNLLTAAATPAAPGFNSCSGLATVPASQRSH